MTKSAVAFTYLLKKYFMEKVYFSGSEIFWYKIAEL